MSLGKTFYLHWLFSQEAWYTSSIGQHAATGYLEERLRNVRKRTAKKNHVSIRKANKTNSDSTASSVSSLESDEGIFMCFFLS